MHLASRFSQAACAERTASGIAVLLNEVGVPEVAILLVQRLTFPVSCPSCSKAGEGIARGRGFLFWDPHLSVRPQNDPSFRCAKSTGSPKSVLQK